MAIKFRQPDQYCDEHNPKRFGLPEWKTHSFYSWCPACRSDSGGQGPYVDQQPTKSGSA